MRFDENDIRTVGRVARGVTGIRFKAGDRVVGMEIVDPQSEILTVTEKGYGKRTEVEEYRLQGRGGQGTINLKVTEKNGPVVGVLQVQGGGRGHGRDQGRQDVRTTVKGINRIGRATQGVIVLKIVDPGDQVASIARLVEGTSRPAEAQLEEKD